MLPHIIAVGRERGKPACNTALAFKAEIDNRKRFENSKDAAAYVGLTPSQYSSGEMHRQGGISKKGSKRTRYTIYDKCISSLEKTADTQGKQKSKASEVKAKTRFGWLLEAV